MIDTIKKYVVIGASSDPEKYGYKVFKDLLEAGYVVYPVNPKGGELLEQRVWPGVLDLVAAGHVIDTAVFVVPPRVAVSLLPALAQAGVKTCWFQPGSESEEAREACTAYGLECVMNACIMIELGKEEGMEEK